MLALNAWDLLPYTSSSQLGVISPPWRYLAMPGNKSGLPQLGGVPGVCWIEAIAAATLPTMHRTASTIMNYLVSNVTSGAVQSPKLCSCLPK